jgi:hypothetical protein
MDNPSFQDDSVRSKTAAPAVTTVPLERPQLPPLPPPVVKRTDADKQSQRKTSQSYQPRSRSNRKIIIKIKLTKINDDLF